MSRFKIKRLLASALVIFFSLMPMLISDASDDIRVMYAVCQDGKSDVKIYVKGTDEEASSYDIGDISAKVPKDNEMEDDESGIRTMILVDTSHSIREEDQDRVRAFLKGLFDSAEKHADEDKWEEESFWISEFGTDREDVTDTFSTDYDYLRHEADNLEFDYKDSYLTDVLDQAIDELENEKYYGYVRIIVISDGMDKNKTDISSDELTSRIKATGYPVYSLGCNKKDNEKRLDNMYALSDISDADHFNVSEDDTEDIIETINEDYDLTFYGGSIPREACDGGLATNNLLTFKDGDSIEFTLQMPYGGGGLGSRGLLIILMGVIAAALVAVLIILLVIKNKRQEEAFDSGYDGIGAGSPQNSYNQQPQGAGPYDVPYNEIPGQQGGYAQPSIPLQPDPYDVPGPQANPYDVPSPQPDLYDVPAPQAAQNPYGAPAPSQNPYNAPQANPYAQQPAANPYAEPLGEEETILFSEAGEEDEKTVLLGKAGGDLTLPTFTLSLTDRTNPNRMARKSFSDVVVIGRSSAADLQFADDRSISGRHCRIFESGGAMFVEDLGSANGTRLNGSPVNSPLQVKDNDILKIGRGEYLVHISVG